MSLTYTDLLEVDLGKLGTAVSDWKNTVDGLKTLSENARKGMQAKSDAARWAGLNATVTRGFVSKTTKEIADLRTEANSIYHVLDDAHTELDSLQKKIKTAVQVDASNLGIRVDDIGDGQVRCFFVHIRGDTDERTQEQLDAKQQLEDRINRLVARASEIDASVARALRKSHGNDPHNAGHSSYDSLDEAQAERAAELAKLGPEMTDKQFTELNSIMKHNAKDPDFSTPFYKSLGGPKEALDFYGRMALDGTTGEHKTRLDLTKQFQHNMGMALASATDPDNKPHLPSSWATEFRRLGTQPIQLQPGAPQLPYGYQILSGLLRSGNYDHRFINPIAEHIVQLHHKDPYRFVSNKPHTGDLDLGFNPSGRSGAGYDPLTGVLEALGHSPQASTKFFNDEVPTVYNDDGTVNKKATLDYNYFDELTDKDFEWPADTLSHPGSDEAEKARSLGPDALGHALESATTGHPYGANPPELHRDEDTAEVMKKVIERYNVTSEDAPAEAMKDSLARMGAAYIDDLNYSIKDFGGSGDELGRDQIFAHSSDGSARTPFEEQKARNFMMLMAGDEDGYKTLTSAQQLYMASGLAAFENDKDHGIAFAQNAAKVHGILDESRSHGIREEFKGAEEAQQMRHEQNGEWRKSLVSGGVTVGVTAGAAMLLGPAAGVVAATAVPLVMESAGSAVSTAYGNHTLEYLKDHEYTNDPAALAAVQDVEKIGERAVTQPILNYAQTVGMSNKEVIDLINEVEQSYLAGKTVISNNEKVSS
ncbi:hypothetical protein PV728_30400 [Streptomyces europaeiscabiei]|uniref:DUF6571 family protein n=1 Tax=Streptomyces europaeiscabiei TaxID=146819 RepID=UPI0029B83505|nr:DUF6571 family protein [Streptomyces europaeiscabiei]MDX3634503.1 hypothetical protein [Streptomyces europaeiscabiei]MDX3653341.1 hypothetical protein [Streptomyces europaeiscabiei]